MTPADRYERRLNGCTATRDAAAARAVRISRLRLATFLGGVALIWWGLASAVVAVTNVAPIAGLGLMIVFGVLVVRHARLLDRVERAEAGRRLAADGLARVARDWNALREVSAPAALNLDEHPYARDLDLFGHASVTKWLGVPATADGARRLYDWLLAPADPAVVVDRQTAIEDLASRHEWRHNFAVEGALTVASASGMDRFLEWAEATAPAMPAAMHAVAVVVPLLTLSLLAAFLAGAIAAPLFLIPLTITVVLSFAFARRMYAVFDRATVGQRALGRYAAMLAMASETTWTAKPLATLQDALRAGGDAPSRVAALARLGGWSELRTGAALLHFPIQALTMWDFHVAFAFERWRTQSGRHVRGWLDTLGQMDALAVLARVRSDEPGWVVPTIDAAEPTLDAGALGHPLIAAARRVHNDVTVGPPGTLLLITGSNMSGKSTLLRAIGVNMVLAQAGAPVCAARFVMPPASVYTSIRVQDSLELGLSYFMAALARLKQIVDAAERGAGPGRTFLYLLDEVLQGTNSIERGLAVRAVVHHLLDARAIGVMTTHDLALAHDEPIASAAQLAHFTEQVHPDGSMTFDYALRAGLATSTNALRLMQLIGIAPR
jgi:ABC-type multidrug transport system fused ATPase/permease subunit